MSTYKRCKTVLLPSTNKVVLDSNKNGIFEGILKGISIKNELIGTLTVNKHPSVGYVITMWQPQHLYILSDEKFIIGDWIVNGNISRSNHAIVQLTTERMVDELNKIADIMNNFNPKIRDIVITKKIIASTDSNLNISFKDGSGSYTMPRPSYNFMQKYCNEHNKGKSITNILVEYNTADENMDSYVDMFGGNPIGETIKINPKDNSVTTMKVRETRTVTEVIELCQKAMMIGVKSQRGKGYSFNEAFLEFLEENNL